MEANVNAWFLTTDWSRSPSVLGVTPPQFTSDGTVIDVDPELNVPAILERPTEERIASLRNIATHEAGHFLGLDHSGDVGEVMYAAYPAFDVQFSELSPDDIEGICALHPPDRSLTCSKPSYSEAGLDAQACEDAAEAPPDSGEDAGACSMNRAAREGSATSWLGALALASILGLRRRWLFLR